MALYKVLHIHFLQMLMNVRQQVSVGSSANAPITPAALIAAAWQGLLVLAVIVQVRNN